MMTVADDAGSRALLRGVLEAPEDDSPRLAYADWLEEYGPASAAARARFIRVQVELARRGEDADDALDLRAQERALLAAHGRDWRAELGALPGVRWGALERGFVACAGFAAVGSLERQLPAVLDRAPATRVRLARLTEDDARRLARCPILTRVRHLDLDDLHFAGPGGWVDLLASPQLGGLRGLSLTHLRHQHLRPAEAAAAGAELARAVAGAAARDLRVLELDHNLIHDEALATVVDSPVAGGLTTLRVPGGVRGVVLTYDQPVTGQHALSALAVAASPRLSRLRVLDLSGAEIGDRGAVALAGSPHLSSLRTLVLASTGVAGRGAGALAAAAGLPALADLDLDFNGVADGGVERILEAGARGLRRLSLVRTRIGGRAAASLARSGVLAGVVDLDLSYNRAVGDGGVSALAGSARAGSLSSLRLRRVGMGCSGLAALAASPHLLSLRRLDVGQNEVGLAGVRALAASPLAPTLSLTLDRCRVPVASRAGLAGCFAEMHAGRPGRGAG